RPFGSRSRAEAAIDEAELRMMRSPLEAEGYRRELRMLLYALHQELSYARTAFETLDGSIIPEAVNAVMLYEERFSLGGGTLLELVDAQDRLLALRNEAVDAARNYHSALAELEYLLGGSPGDGG